jgi:hypothetical protein
LKGPSFGAEVKGSVIEEARLFEVSEKFDRSYHERQGTTSVVPHVAENESGL